MYSYPIRLHIKLLLLQLKGPHDKLFIKGANIEWEERNKGVVEMGMHVIQMKVKTVFYTHYN